MSDDDTPSSLFQLTLETLLRTPELINSALVAHLLDVTCLPEAGGISLVPGLIYDYPHELSLILSALPHDERLDVIMDTEDRFGCSPLFLEGYLSRYCGEEEASSVLSLTLVDSVYAVAISRSDAEPPVNRSTQDYLPPSMYSFTNMFDYVLRIMPVTESKSEWLELIKLDGSNGGTLLHALVGNCSLFRQILESVSRADAVVMLNSKVRGDYTVLHEACKYGLAEVVDCILNFLNPSERLELVKAKLDIHGEAALYLACRRFAYTPSTDPGLVRTLLSYFCRSQCMELLSLYTFGETPLHMVTRGRDSQAITDIYKSVTKESWSELLVMPDFEQGFLQTPLHIAMASGSTDCVIAILSTCTDDEKIKLLRLLDIDGIPPMHVYFTNAHAIFRYVLGELSDNHRYEIIRQTYSTYYMQLADYNDVSGNHLHHAIYDGDAVMAGIILDFVNESERMSLITSQNHQGETPFDLINIRLDSASVDRCFVQCETNVRRSGSSDISDWTLGLMILDAILRKLSDSDCEQVMQLLLVRAFYKSHLNYDNLPFVLPAIVINQNYSSPSSQLNIIGERSEGVESLINAKFNYRDSQICRSIKSRSLKILSMIRTAVKIRIVESLHVTTSSQAKTEWIDNIIEHEPLTRDQILELSSHSRRYIIPHHTINSKRYGLILFCAAGRQGALEEADNLEQALAAVGCDVIKIEWLSTDELSSMIDSSMALMDDCSLLFVCFMSHGHRGTLSGGDNSKISVNDILHQLTNSLPAHLPMILLVQACQGFVIPGIQPDDYSSESDPATLSHTIDPHNSKHIVLQRPHTALVLATVTGGLATRGAFTGAVADELLQSDGRTEIHSMFTNAVYRMSITDPDQTPEFRSTLKKALVLPPIINNAATIPQT